MKLFFLSADTFGGGVNYYVLREEGFVLYWYRHCLYQ